MRSAVVSLYTRDAAWRGALVTCIALAERLFAPALVYAIVAKSHIYSVLGGVALACAFALRGRLERGAVARFESDLYKRIVTSVLNGDASCVSPLSDDEARAGAFEGIHRTATVFAETVPNLGANALAAVALAAVAAATFNHRVMAVGAVAITCAALLLFTSRGWVSRAQERAWRSWMRVIDGVTDAFDGRLEIIASGNRESFRRAFELGAKEWLHAATHLARAAVMAGRLPVLAVAASVAVAIVVDGRIRGSSWSESLAQAGFLASCAPAFMGFARGLQDLIRVRDRLLFINRLLCIPAESCAGTQRAPTVPRSIEWRDVRMAYQDAQGNGSDVLHGVSFVLRPGEVIALAGPNGSGKTTCIRALLGFGRPTAGAVLVDGTAVPDLQLDAWRRCVAFLPQAPYFAARCTIREALRFLDSDFSDDALLEALDRVGATSSIGTGAMILERRMSSLSVGQRQRVALARVLCRRAKVIVLDEPDANLDRSGISMLARIVRELAKDSLVMLVAHSEELLNAADRVIVLDGGRVAGQRSRRSDGLPLVIP